MQAQGWTLLFHDCITLQLQKLEAAVARAETSDPNHFSANANVKLFHALSKLILETIPNNPTHDNYRQGNTMGSEFRHWRRAKIGRRFRLFFRYDSTAKIIIYAWVNDEQSLRSSGSKTDPYVLFRKMLSRGNPPDDWSVLVATSRDSLTFAPLP
ncbi:MAG: type II toxin-antitoxin system YhaV family toxin [Ottowia sp.]|nr:type II toxin-antitoxin system YhaV family toxin [Ottowia sp.]